MTSSIPLWVMFYVKIVIQDYFSTDLKNVKIQLLQGGYSSSSNVLLEIDRKKYVLRVSSELESALKRKTELHAMKESSMAGIAPKIHWVSSDGHAVLMDHIAGKTLTTAKSKKSESISKIAHLQRKIHALPKNSFHSPSFESQMEEFYLQYSPQDTNQVIWNEAISIIKEGSLKLQSLNAPTVNTHGDLNPRNILVSDQDEIFFIDWGDGMYTEPFLDLSFFSIMMDFDPKEENYLVQCYLGHAPDIEEKKRFLISKKMNFARLVLSGQGIGNQLSIDHNQKNKSYVLKLPKEWSYYVKTFADENELLSPEFFWGQAQAALEKAKTINMN